ncbi:MAG: hypothetical protein V4793_14980 [Paraburkholderia tropica]|uniref:Uncharacterized protein n=1 Tax=Paraburkholderia tropica TaxID=92647 RepID=A0AAQ1GMD9_9BURK|nr:hypothetical protein [Paraburkholderia tropica]MBB2984260.1 hypothetical protein [Paraburkholderia tropica]MBB3005003.1 hypothetical protein [Paraburkholderia tropica]MBB6323291.1 hypothetical protein [Paraburkholderia tropica]PXX05087.1 hypothetical protein C7400_14454 [Paraburkholderia tropica]PZW70515.1 hypothetical protein C7399_14454 [Paraburkholderia tropica]
MDPYITFDVFWRGMSAWLTLIGALVGAPCVAYVVVKVIAGWLRRKRAQ